MINSTPDGLKFVPVQLTNYPEIQGTLAYRSWSPAERRQRAFKRTGKIIGMVFGCSLIGLFVHILLLIIIPGLFITLILTAPTFLKFLGEEESFFYVEAKCPHCQAEGKLRPYLATEFKAEVTAQCALCGQTTRVHTLR